MIRKLVHGLNYAAVLEDDSLVEYLPLDRTDGHGDILVGKAGRLMTGTESAFVDIGRARSGFLPLREGSGSFTGGSVRSGDRMIVQIKKEEAGEKGAFLTRDITLPGQWVILMPMNRYIGVSNRISDEESRGRLKSIGKKIAGDRFGLILRNAASDAEETDLIRETQDLYRLWQEIEQKAAGETTPGRMIHSFNPLQQLREDYASGKLEECNETADLSGMIRRQLRLATQRKLRLPSGGNVVLDLCEAMTVIDVNTASTVSSGSKRRTVLETNLEACRMIAQQVRLRDLSGMILIDFIDMETDSDRDQVRNCLEQHFAADRRKTVVHGWTNLGLMEMTRKRTGPGLLESLLTVCPACGGKGMGMKEMDA